MIIHSLTKKRIIHRNTYKYCNKKWVTNSRVNPKYLASKLGVMINSLKLQA